MQKYGSPRWSQEFPDCSLPMTFDQYSVCSYKCLYCFSQYQKALGKQKEDYLLSNIKTVPPESMIALFDNALQGHPEKISSSERQFAPFIAARRAMQWGGLADPFDEHERKLRLGLQVMRYMREQEYPVAFSTKGTWWLDDPEYIEVFKGAKNFHVKFSIITLDEEKARIVESGVDSPEKRLRAIEKARKLGLGVNLRLRPFIIGISTPDHCKLIQRAADAGAQGVSTEFFCLEMRSTVARVKYRSMSKMAGFDLLTYYKKHSVGSGYLRLNKEVKRPFIDEMEAACRKAGIGFFVSDAHFKERCDNGSCCGLPAEWNWSRGQFTEAIQIAKRNGTVAWTDISGHLEFTKKWLWRKSCGFNTNSSDSRAKYYLHTFYEYLRWCWNNPSSGKSPYKMFLGILKPVSKDAEGNLIYAYDSSRA